MFCGSAGTSFEQILPYLLANLDDPEVDSDKLETPSGEDNSTLETEHVEE